MNATVYLTRNGLLEPLGQSQVLAYLRGLSRNHCITLITFEKPDNWNDTDRVESARSELKSYGIVWKPQLFKSGPRFIAPALSMLRMGWLSLHEVRKGHVELIHARSYIPAAVALFLNKLTGVPFIFDMRALWPEELITAGRLKRGSILHRIIVWVERRCLARAAAVVSLTNAAVVHLRREYPVELENQRIALIPTCADLDRFAPALNQLTGPMAFGCVGTVLSGWFRTDLLAGFFSTAAALDPLATFEVVTRDDEKAVRQAIDRDDKLDSRLSIRACLPEQMSDVVRTHHVSVMFFTTGLSKLGSAPTRLAEVLGCGLPVVANEGVGDMGEIISKYKVGVLVNGSTHDEMLTAWHELQALLADPNLKRRCRQAAEEVFSLESGTAAYAELYRKILDAE